MRIMMAMRWRLNMMNIFGLSPVNAVRLTEVIRDVLIQTDPEHREEYEGQAEQYKKELERIHQELCRVSRERKRNLIVVGDKFPFRYLAEEYDLDYRAAFPAAARIQNPVPGPSHT